MSAPFLRIARLRHFFKTGEGSREVLRVHELSVRKGEFLALTGPSGGGKSTLINLLAGFFKPAAGQILKNGEALSGPGPDRAVVFQRPTLFPWRTALQNVAYGLANRGLDKVEITNRAQDMLELVGLANEAASYPSALSGGMAQRVALARALAPSPEILLLDEPFASLDEANRAKLGRELCDIWQSQGCTIIMVTHHLEEAVLLADRIALLAPPPIGMLDIFEVNISRFERNEQNVASLTRQLRAAMPK